MEPKDKFDALNKLSGQFSEAVDELQRELRKSGDPKAIAAADTLEQAQRMIIASKVVANMPPEGAGDIDKVFDVVGARIKQARVDVN